MLVTEKELVIIKNEIPVISHIVIAEKTNNDKDSLVLAFRNLKNIFSERMPKTLPEALRMYAEQLEKTEQLVLENKELERTKAWINNKKTATAMNTASRYAKINKELKIKLDNSKEYATVKRMELLYH